MVTKETLIDILNFSGVKTEEVNKIKQTPGKIKEWGDVKMLLDLSTTLTEVEKQCIVNSCYRKDLINSKFN